MNSRVTSEAATVQADIDAVFDSLARAMESFEAEFEGSDGFKVVWREHLASLTFHTIEKVRQCICDLRAIVEEGRSAGEETGLLGPVWSCDQGCDPRCRIQRRPAHNSSPAW